MRQIDVATKGDPSKVTSRVEAVAASMNLHEMMKGTLKTFPDCVHWHYKKGRQAGALEVTWWIPEGKLWISIHEGRNAD